jgi:hypothetical protein
MKQMNKTKKTKKIKISFVLKTIVVLIALSSMLLNSILGVTKSEYFKSLSKKLDLEVMPDVGLQYYIFDGDTTTSTSYKGQKGVYEGTTSFVQQIIIGKTKTYKVGSATIIQEKISYIR